MFSLIEGVYRLKKQFVLQTASYPTEESNINPLSIDLEPTPNYMSISVVIIENKDSSSFSLRPLLLDKPAPIQQISSLDQINKSISSKDINNEKSEKHSFKQENVHEDFPSQDLSCESTVVEQNIFSTLDNINNTEKPLPNLPYIQKMNALKKNKKPKNKASKTSSSFISQIALHEDLTKILTSKTKIIHIFSATNKVFNWITMSPQTKEELLSKIVFTKAHITCHDANQFTCGFDHIDIVFGFSSSDIVWFDPISTKYTRLNKHGSINSSSVNCIKWIPGSKSLFMAAHDDGALIIYHKEKEKCNFVKNDNPENISCSTKFKVLKSLLDPENKKCNPVSYWQLFKQSPTSFSFSPVSCHVAVVFSDGTLKIIDYKNENYRLLDIYHSWFGGLICVCWSQNGQYILTGGEDDLVTIWSFSDKTIIARCKGHHSWVTGVAFDPWKCNEGHYRFGSIGADCQLLLWDFNINTLNKSKDFDQTENNFSLEKNNFSSEISSQNHKTKTNNKNELSIPIDHPLIQYTSVPILSPIMSKVLDDQWLTQLIFCEKYIIVSGKNDHIQIWERP
ncbi:hypothetical protein PORY_001045 [Pneumocystis oryctolagi]|uniref:Uncharacterized protein n=1 Tax=Pneumocystis oryctolagi TaxID=42067 RepID=A0ACB7CF33_9ASCO|nr:hypothetical protein PORY_001045 [Pneumocystis oryctolagi]